MSKKTPISRGLPLFTDATVQKHIQRLGKCLPAVVKAVNGSIVTVSFQVQGVQLPQVTMPVFGPEYIRYPIQVGDKGVCFAADTYLGGMSGLGTGTADMRRRGNLSTLVFFPIGNKNWTAPDDANAVVIYGPNGVILRDSDSNSIITLTPSDIDADAQNNFTAEAGTEIQLTVGNNSVLINSSEIILTVGAATLTMNATGIVSTVPITAPTVTGSTGVVAGTSLTVAGKEMSGHEHHVAGITTGGSTVTSGPPL